MKTYKVTLILTLKEGNPDKWNWYEALDLQQDEEVWASSKEVTGECYMCGSKDGEPHQNSEITNG
jgi:hypothetical protein